MDPYSPNNQPPATPAPQQTYPPNPGYGQSGQGQSFGGQSSGQYGQASQGYNQPQQQPPQSFGQPQQPGQFNQGWGFNQSNEPTPVQSQVPNDPAHQLPSMGNQPPPTSLNNQNTHLTPPPRPKRYDKQPFFLRMVEWLKGHWWAPVLVVLGLVILGDIAYQVILPYDRIPAGVKIDGLDIGGLKKDEAVKKINKAYADAEVEIFFGSASVPQQTTRVADLGISVNNKQRLEGVSYPVWLRLVPSSSFWVAATQSIPKPVYSYDTVTIDEYTLRHLGNDCRIEPKDATIRLDDGLFKAVPSEPGGTCDVAEFKSKVRTATVENGGITIKVSMNEEDAKLGEEDVAGLVEQLNKTLGKNIPISANNISDEIPSGEAKSWLSFRTVTPEAPSENEPAPDPFITYDVDKEYIQEFVDKSKLTEAVQKPGVTKISTHNYQETGRTEGSHGTAIELDAAVAGFRNVADGKAENVVVPVVAVGPKVEFTRTYDPTHEGFKALVEHFVADNEGKIGIVTTDLSGGEPRVDISVNDRQKVVAGGVESLFLAYVAQAGIDDGTLQPTTRVSGSRDYTQCIEDVLISQDRDCLDGLLNTMGNAYVQQKMSQTGLHDTNFSGEQNITSARDIYTLTRAMEEGDAGLRSKSSLLSLMRRNLTREGLYSVVPQNTSVATSNSENVANQGALVNNQGKYVIAFASEGAGDLEIIEKFIKSYEELRSKKPRR